MKKIKQSVDVDFSCISIQDAIKMVPLMDLLQDALKKQAPIRCGTQESYGELPPELLIGAYKVLRELGFCSSIEEDPEITRLGKYK